MVEGLEEWWRWTEQEGGEERWGDGGRDRRGVDKKEGERRDREESEH